MVEIGIKPPVILNYLSKTTDYSECISKMHALHESVVAKKLDSTVIITRHNPVITGGLLNAKLNNKTFSVPFISTNRGGGITYHDPGQLVVYPILRLVDFGIAPGEYIQILQHWAANTVRLLGCLPLTFPDRIGVWISDHASESKTYLVCENSHQNSGPCFTNESTNQDLVKNIKKVAFIGARIKSGVALHGFSVNLHTNLEVFHEFDPCGIVNLNIGNLFSK